MLPVLKKLKFPLFTINLHNHLTRPIKFVSEKGRLYSISRMSTESRWQAEKKKLEALPIEEKRKMYKGGDYIPLVDIHPWDLYCKMNKLPQSTSPTGDDLHEFEKITLDASLNEKFSKRISIFKGDITKLEIDAIVNAANSRLKAGGGVDGAIHRAAGQLLQAECDTLGGCPTGEARITGGYNLPAKYVIHTVGPQNGSAPNLQSCYEKCFAFKNEYHVRSIAFPCISTGIYGFPNRLASHIALRTARKFLEANSDMDRVIFCTFMPIDVEIYETLMPLYFPVTA